MGLQNWSGAGLRQRMSASLRYRGKTEGEQQKRKGGISGKQRSYGSGRKSLGLSLLSFPGSAVQEKRRLKWRRRF